MNRQVALVEEVEDDDVIRDNYAEMLADEGFNVVPFKDRDEALKHFQTALPDVAILDIELNGDRDGGFRLCADLRRLSLTMPIIFFTSRDEEIDRISGIRVGADDYITKDIGINYLMVRIDALLHRVHSLTQFKKSYADAEDTDQTLFCGSLEIDLVRLLAFWKNKPVDLSLIQFLIVKELASNEGEIKSHNKLMQAAHTCVEPNTISAHIKTIRDQFRTVDADWDCIKTERGAGYRWVEV